VEHNDELGLGNIALTGQLWPRQPCLSTFFN